LPDLIERPRAWIGRFHSTDECCDAAKRMSDATTLHSVAGFAGKFIIIRLIDGEQVDRLGLYSTREEAEPRKTHPAQIVVQVPPGGIRAAECEEILHYHREVYDKVGSRPFEVGYMQPLTRRDQRRQIRVLQKGRR
jgi:hypothetical protein